MPINPSKVFIEASHELLSRGYGVRFRAPGHSMHPTIKDGEMITVEPVTAEEVNLGDIIFYRSRNGVIAHRMVRFDRGSGAMVFIMRGDGTTSCDAPVTPDQILGRVVSVERDGRGIDPCSRSSRLLRIGALCASRLKASFRSILWHE